ncbi:MAG: adenylate/guanylate cyclase domain-containing protein [Gammaproteobacteria bacterium]
MSQLLHKIATLWSSISGIGNRSRDYDESRRIILSNQIAALGVLTMLAYDVIYLAYDPLLLVGPITVNVIGALVCITVLYLNHHEQYGAARLLIYISTNIQIYLLTYYLGTVTGMHLLHIMMISFAGFFFARETRLRLFSLLAMPVLLFFIEYFLFTPGNTPIELNPAMIHFLYFTLSATTFILVMVFFSLFYKEILRTEDLLQKEYQRSESLLLNILPKQIADRLKQKEHTIADSYSSVTILFADLVGFTDMAAKLHPEMLVDQLNRIYQEYDALLEKYDVEKIKTLGDAYMIAGGLPVARDDHMELIAHLALDMRDLVKKQNIADRKLDLRIGFHSGPVVAGVIGNRKFSYDVWGDTVNIASRLESTGVPGTIQVSGTCYEELKDKFHLEERGEIDVKGVGKMRTYFLNAAR